MENSATVAQYFPPVELPSNNYSNLLELPLLFYAIVPLLILTEQVTSMQPVLAWAFVALRIVHSVVHIIVRPVPIRTLVFLLSGLVLMAMWIVFVIHISQLT